MSRWQRLARRRRLRALLTGLRAGKRSYQIASLVAKHPRYVLVTNHLIVARHLLEELADLGRKKLEAIEAQDWEKAAALRDRERSLQRAMEKGMRYA